MPESLRKSLASTEVQSLDLRMAKSSMPVHRPDSSVPNEMSADAVSLVLAALHDCGMSDKEACLHMHFDASQFSRVKKGTARLPFDALWLLPDRFWLAFRDQLEAAKNLTNDNAVKVKAARIAELVRLLVEVA